MSGRSPTCCARAAATIKVEELAARLAELEQGGGRQRAQPEGRQGRRPTRRQRRQCTRELRELAQRLEEAEKAAKADRDKVLTQLERMASSIDWRVRRLESGETDAAA